MTSLLDNSATAHRPGEHAARVACDHCGLPVPVGLVQRDQETQFCCHACRSAYEIIHGCGLENYYRLRAQAGESPAATQQADNERLAVFDSQKFTEQHIRPLEDGTLATDLMLEGVRCAACVWLIEKLPRVVPGVLQARLSMRQATVRLVWDPEQVRLSQIATALSTLGYTPHPQRGGDKRWLHLAEQRAMLVRLGVAGAIAGNTMLLAFALYAGMFGGMEAQFSELFRWISAALGVLSLAWPGRVFFRGAWAAIKTRSPHLDLPIALALGVGGVAGAVNVIVGRGEIYFDSLTVLVFLLLVGRFIQHQQQRRADDAVSLLFSLTPSTCRRVCATDQAQAIEQVPIEAVQAADLLEVRSGELIPADGIVERGRASVIASMLTGESRPQAIEPGDMVYAGSRLSGATIRLRVSAVAEQTRAGRLMTLVQQGVEDKPVIIALTDRIAGWFVCVVSVAALAVFAVWSVIDLGSAVDHTVALLIIACPCALGLATPLTLAVAIGRSARRDILIKSGAALDKLARPGRLLIDKTGTITRGEMRVEAWLGDTAPQPIAAEIERHATHPIGHAIVQRFGEQELTVDQRAAVTDIKVHRDGIEAATHLGRVCIGSRSFMQRKTVVIDTEHERFADHWAARASTPVFVGVDGRVAAVMAIGDAVHEDSQRSLETLRAWGWRITMLTGDERAVAEQVGRAVGFKNEQIRAGVTPEQKLLEARAREGGRATVMVGDGVNDAAALAAADVGVAVSGGAEASMAAADIYTARPGLAGLVDLIATARACRRVVKRNLVVSLAYNATGITLAAAGLLSPLVAAVMMPASSALVLALAMHGQRHAAGVPTQEMQARP